MTMLPAHHHAGPGRCYHIDCVTGRAIELARTADDARQLALVWNQAAAGLPAMEVTDGHVEDWHRKCESDDCDLEVCLQVPFDGDHGAAPCCEHGFCEDHRSDCQDCTVTDRADARW